MFFINTPKILAFVHADRMVSYYRIKLSFDGRVKIVKSKKPPKANRMVLFILDHSLVFKRLSVINPSQLKSKQNFLSVAEDLFPFDSENTYYAMNTIDQQNYFFAIEKLQLKGIIDPLPGKKRAILVARNNHNSLLNTVQKWLVRTPFMDLSASALSAPLYALTNGTFFLFTLVLSSLLFFYGHSFYQEHLQSLDHQFTTLEKKAQPLYNKLNSTRSMQQSYQKLFEFSNNCSHDSLSIVEEIISKIPENSELSRIEFTDQQLIIKGKSKDVNSWFTDKTLFKDMVIDSSPEYDYFTLRINCKEFTPENK